MSKREVLEKLLEDHVGEENAVSHAQLSESLAVSKSTVADLVQEIRDDTDMPALGTNKGGNSGTYVISSKEELKDQLGIWNREKQRIKDRIENTLKSYDEWDGELPETEANDIIEPTYECAEPDCDREMPKDERRYPEGYDQPICKHCYGDKVIKGQL